MEINIHNMETNSDFERYQRAKKRVKDIKGFYGNLTSYIIVMLFFIFLNLKYSPKHLWFIYPMLGWGMGVVAHAIGVFKLSIFFSKEWEERKIKKYIEEEKEKIKSNYE